VTAAARSLRAAGLAVAGTLAGTATPLRAAGPVDVARLVALGDGLTAGFVNGNLFDGATARVPERQGQRECVAARVAESLGAEVRLPFVAWPGRAPRSLTIRDPAVCRFGNDAALFDTESGTGRRVDPSVAATVVAVPFQTAGDARTLRWDLDPALPATADTDEDMILGQPAASAGTPPSTQLESALAQRPTFATVWFGVEEAMRPLRIVPRPAVAPSEFERNLDAIVGSLAQAGARGAVANVPDVTEFPYFVDFGEFQSFATEEHDCERVPGDAILILFGLRRGSFLVRDVAAFQAVRNIQSGQMPPRGGPRLPRNAVVTRAEARQSRAAVRAMNSAVVRVAARHDWAVVDVASLVDGWHRDGATVGGRKLTTKFLGGLFDVRGESLSATGSALVAAEFVRAIDARYGTAHALPDAATALAADPLAPCDSEAPCPERRR
jgi:hypothetical protein